NETDVPFSSLGDVRRNGVRSVSTAEGSRAAPSLAGRLPTKNPRSSACGKVGDGTPTLAGSWGTRPPEWLVVSSPAKRSMAAEGLLFQPAIMNKNPAGLKGLSAAAGFRGLGKERK